ncbi:hypothetical protein [Arenibaculum pallidiluteum]|uniref:hypothetical protein n=1 Tax=Arenibaculum pallidiluteum TaxID=2812559 RepID=UPI001A95AAB9|nr:hypothetical protein [Arenibaculum pallidiluteum]
MPFPRRPDRKWTLLAGLMLATLLPGCAGDGAEPSATAGLASEQAMDSGAASRIVLLHTRLMVAGLGCGPMWQDPSAFSRYSAFVARNAQVISSAQQGVATRLGGMAAFDAEHTVLSNRESLRMNMIGMPAYCAEMRGPFYAAMLASPADLAILPY